MHVCIHTYMHECMHACIRIYCMHIHVCSYVCMYVYEYACMYVCMYVPYGYACVLICMQAFMQAYEHSCIYIQYIPTYIHACKHDVCMYVLFVYAYVRLYAYVHNYELACLLLRACACRKLRPCNPTHMYDAHVTYKTPHTCSHAHNLSLVIIHLYADDTQIYIKL